MKIEFRKEISQTEDDKVIYCTYIDGHYAPGTLSFDKEIAYKLYLKEIEKAKNPIPNDPEILESVEI